MTIFLDKNKEEYKKEVRARETLLRIKGRKGKRAIDKARVAVDFLDGDYDELDIPTMIKYIEELKDYDEREVLE